MIWLGLSFSVKWTPRLCHPGCTKQRFCCPGIAACVPQLLLVFDSLGSKEGPGPGGVTCEDLLPFQPVQDLFFFKADHVLGAIGTRGTCLLSPGSFSFCVFTTGKQQLQNLNCLVLSAGQGTSSWYPLSKRESMCFTQAGHRRNM